MPVALGLVAGSAGCGDPAESVEVLSPAAGAAVALPFDVTLDAGVPLGSPADDLHHVHIWFGDELESYLVVETDTVEITSAPAGNHELHVSLRLPDHSAAGVETSVPLIIDTGS